MRVRVFTAIFFLLAAIAGLAQAVQPTSPEPSPAEPAITFTLDFPQSVPSHYSLRVLKSGQATYESMGKLTPEADGDPFSYTFTMSSSGAARLFDLAANANYFEADVDYKKGRQANTGKKTLAYQDSMRHNRTEFNYSTNQEIQQLTRTFQSKNFIA